MLPNLQLLNLEEPTEASRFKSAVLRTGLCLQSQQAAPTAVNPPSRAPGCNDVWQWQYDLAKRFAWNQLTRARRGMIPFMPEEQMLKDAASAGWGQFNKIRNIHLQQFKNAADLRRGLFLVNRNRRVTNEEWQLLGDRDAYLRAVECVFLGEYPKNVAEARARLEKSKQKEKELERQRNDAARDAARAREEVLLRRAEEKQQLEEAWAQRIAGSSWPRQGP